MEYLLTRAYNIGKGKKWQALSDKAISCLSNTTNRVQDKTGFMLSSRPYFCFIISFQTSLSNLPPNILYTLLSHSTPPTFLSPFNLTLILAPTTNSTIPCHWLNSTDPSLPLSDFRPTSKTKNHNQLLRKQGRAREVSTHYSTSIPHPDLYLNQNQEETAEFR